MATSYSALSVKDQVQLMYVAYFGRAGDPAGVDHWINDINVNHFTIEQVGDTFALQSEAKGLYSYLAYSNLGDPTAFVTAIYNNLFERAPDTAGLNYWVDRLTGTNTNGTNSNLEHISAGTMIAAIINGAYASTGTNHANDVASMENKIQVADYFTQKLIDNHITWDPASMRDDAAACIANVTGDSTTIDDGKTTADASVNAFVGTSGQTFTLTTGMDKIVGTGLESVTALENNGGVLGGETWNSGDSITNVKNVNLMVTTADTIPAVVTMQDVANVNVTSYDPNTLNAAAFTNVGTINATGGQGAASILTVNNGSIATTYAVADTSASGIIVSLRAAELTGAADTIKFAANTAGSTTAGAVGTAPVVATATFTSATTGVETVSVDTTGTNVFNVVANNTAITDATKLVITGSGNNTIGTAGMTNVAVYDMSGASGTNTLNVAGTLTTGDVIKGGTGTDTLRMNNASTIANITVTGVETLRLSTGSSTGTAIFTAGPSFTTVRVDGDNSETGTQTLTNLGAVTKLQYKGDALTVNSGAAQQFNSLSMTNSFTGSADTLAVSVDNGGVTAAGGYTLGALIADGVETMTVDVKDLGATGTATFTGITDNTLSSLAVTSTGVVNLGTVTATNAAGTAGMLTSLDMSAVQGATASSVNFAANTLGSVAVINATQAGGMTTTFATATQAGNTQIIYTGGAGVDNFNSSTNATASVVVIDGKGGNDIIKTGVGNDVITGGEGADNITGGAGNDTINLTETVSAVDKIFYAESGAANVDTVSGFKVGTDIVGYSVAAGAFDGATTTFSDGNGTAITTAPTSIDVLSVTAGTTTANLTTDLGSGNRYEMVKFASTTSTDFATAINGSGTGSITISDANLSATERVAAVFYDATNGQAVFGYILNTDSTTSTNVIDSNDTFIEVVRVGMTATDYTSFSGTGFEFF
ncbi:MAG: DUF4214 domain-containing protein [Deltaproteobacteria bacterium]|nr:DUF4214 domain-containing protein [Deltaproteobacteria bacterium]